MKKLKNFFQGVGKEASRIHWTSRKDLVKYSFTCIILIVFFGVYFFALDALFAFLKGVIS